MIDELRSRVDRILADHGMSATAIAGEIVVGADPDPDAKATVIFVGADGMPVAVAKTARRASGERALAAEHRVLGHLWRMGASSVRSDVPRPLGLCRVSGRVVLVTTALAGNPMTSRYYRPGHVSDPGAVGQDFRLAAAWLRTFQSETRTGDVTLGSRAVGRWVQPSFERYRDEIGWGRDEDALLREVRRRATELAGLRIPAVAVHGDYAPGNLLIERGRIRAVVDWECGSRVGLPFRDVYKFPTSYGLYLDRAVPRHRGEVPGHPGRAVAAARWSRFGQWPNLAGFAYSYFGAGWFPDLVRRFVLTELGHLGIPAAANAVFFPVFLAEQALALPDQDFREGYRAALRGLWGDRDSTWLWRAA